MSHRTNQTSPHRLNMRPRHTFCRLINMTLTTQRGPGRPFPTHKACPQASESLNLSPFYSDSGSDVIPLACFVSDGSGEVAGLSRETCVEFAKLLFRSLEHNVRSLLLPQGPPLDDGSSECCSNRVLKTSSLSSLTDSVPSHSLPRPQKKLLSILLLLL